MKRKHPMADTNQIHDHYTVISRVGEVDTSRVVIAGSSTDAAETHRENYPSGAIIRVSRQATASVMLTA
jgi:hypothetical protein